MALNMSITPVASQEGEVVISVSVTATLIKDVEPQLGLIERKRRAQVVDNKKGSNTVNITSSSGMDHDALICFASPGSCARISILCASCTRRSGMPSANAGSPICSERGGECRMRVSAIQGVQQERQDQTGKTRSHGRLRSLLVRRKPNRRGFGDAVFSATGCDRLERANTHRHGSAVIATDSRKVVVTAANASPNACAVIATRSLSISDSATTSGRRGSSTTESERYTQPDSEPCRSRQEPQIAVLASSLMA